MRLNKNRLDLLEEMPSKIKFHAYLKEQGTNSWDYADKKCRYHNRTYGNYYSFAQKILEKYVGQELSVPTKILRKDSRYKHNYFFRMAIEEALSEISKPRWYGFRYNTYVLDKTDYTYSAFPSRTRYEPKEEEQTSWTYPRLGVKVVIREGIHYFEDEPYHYGSAWSSELQEEVCKEFLAKYTQLNKSWLRYLNLTNKDLEK